MTSNGIGITTQVTTTLLPHFSESDEICRETVSGIETIATRDKVRFVRGFTLKTRCGKRVSHGGSHWFESSIAHLNRSNPAETRGFFIFGDSVRLKNTTCRRTARRNARRFLEVAFTDLKVMLACDFL